jgi:protein SCO1/2
MKRTLIAALIWCAAAAATVAQTPTQPAPPNDPHAGHRMPEQPAAQEPSAAQKYFSDVKLVDQDGRAVRFYTDMLKGKTVIVNAFFTTCTSVCPPMSRNLEQMQAALGDRLGRDVFIVSISVDPLTDTPPRLKQYAQRFHAKPGWCFLTGQKENVDMALYKLGQYVEDKNDHTTIMIVGNEATGLWKKVFGLAKADELLRLVNEVANDKGVPATP